MRLKGKTALVTGGTSGIGAATARRFLAEGANVLLADVIETGADAIIRDARDSSACWLLLDVTREDHWTAGVERALTEFGRLDILVNSAGRSSQVTGDPMDAQAWRGIMDVNAAGAFFGAKAAVPVMQESGGGSIINIASIMALVGGEGGHPAYHASKGAVRALTKTLAVRYGKHGIRVNAVYPGFLPPMRTGKPLPSDMLEKLVAWTPLGRTGTPEDVAAGVAFLASDDAAFVTGAELVIDGGFVSR
ncbi:MAG: glucose 1-dehydrogenase [Rhizobiaceae bacterium]|nr:glucose 1-dehydrogenase [Rhizobiaceae bacterium]